MVTEWTTAAWFLPFVAPIALWVAWSDLSKMTIPNKAVLAQLIVFALVGLLALPFEEYLWRYLHVAVVFAVGILVWKLGLLGGGDAKYAIAMSPFIAAADVAPFFYLILAPSMIGGFLLHRLARSSGVRAMVPNWESWENVRDYPLGFSLGPALIIYLIVCLF